MPTYLVKIFFTNFEGVDFEENYKIKASDPKTARKKANSIKVNVEENSDYEDLVGKIKSIRKIGK